MHTKTAYAPSADLAINETLKARVLAVVFGVRPNGQR